MHKKFFVRSAMVLVISYFMLVGVLYSQNVNSSSAKRTFPATPVAPGCVQGIKQINTGGRCRSSNLINGFRTARFECYGGSGGQLHSRACVSFDSLNQAASESCLRMSTCRLPTTPTPTANPVPPPTCLDRPACLDEDPACLMPEPEGGWCVSAPTDPTPTPCAMPTAPLCQNGTLRASDEPQSPGVCGPKYVCIINEEPTPAGELTE